MSGQRGGAKKPADGAEISAQPIATLGQKIKRRELSPVELTKAYLRRIEEYNAVYNAFVTIDREGALEQARAAEREIAGGSYRGPLHGIPIAHKDLYCTKGMRTTAGSRVLWDYVPDYDATVVRKYREAGTIVLGKTNTHEFAYGPTSKISAFGPSKNPWDPDRITAGSSGGSAVAVLLSMCGAATGTDTGGSIRMPSSACGIVGIKPTFGLVSRFGVVPLCWTMDHAGPMTRTVRDAALMLQPIAGRDPNDPTTAKRTPPDYAAALTGEVRGLRIGVPTSHFYDGVDPEVAAIVMRAVAVLEHLGAETREVAIPFIEYADIASTILHLSEPPAYHDDTIRAHPELFTQRIRKQILMGSYILAKDYVQAERYRRLLGQSFAKAFADVDVLITPTLPVVAPRLSDDMIIIRDKEQPVFLAMEHNTVPLDLTGLPALTLPCGFSVHGLPVGMQVVAPAFREDLAFKVGDAYERATDWRAKQPEVLTAESRSDLSR